jgi:hypothetical protein
MKIKNIRTFLPSLEFNVSKQFYLEIGFEILWEDDTLIIFGTNENNFFLQKGYNKDWAENMMIQLHVEDLDHLHGVAVKLSKNYNGVRVNEIFTAHYGRTFHLIGPAGELWHMTEFSN